MSFYEIANSTLLYICVAIGIIYVLGLSVVYFKKSWKRGIEVGFTKKDLIDVVKSSASFSVVPSLAIVIGLFSLIAMLGIPWPWFRLSVIGSVAYEIMAADAALKATGAELATAGGEMFVLIMYVMSICILGGVTSSIFISKKIQNGAIKMKERDQRWGALGNSTFMMSILVVLLIPMLISGGVTLLTWLTSLVVTLILGILISKFKMSWLKNFVLALSLLIAMASSVAWTNLLG